MQLFCNLYHVHPKMNNQLRYVNEQHGSPVNRFRVIARAADRGLAVGRGEGAAAHDGARGVWWLRWGTGGRSVAGGGDATNEVGDNRGSGRVDGGGGVWGWIRSGGGLGTQVGALLLPVKMGLLKGQLAFSLWRRARKEARDSAKQATIEMEGGGGGGGGGGSTAVA